MYEILLDKEMLDSLLYGSAKEYLIHYGVGHDDNPPGPGSPGNWGQGENAYQRVSSFITMVENRKHHGHLTEEDIAKLEGFPDVEQFHKRYLYEKEYAGTPQRFCSYVDTLKKETKDGKRRYSDDEIAKMVGCRDVKALNDSYTYHKAVWEKIPDGYKLNSEFDKQLDALEEAGYTPAQIALGLGMTTSQLKARKSIAVNAGKQEMLEENRKLLEGIKDENGEWIRKPITNRSERARILGVSEPTLRSRENGQVDKNTKIIFETAEKLKAEMQKNMYLDVGKGTAERMNIKPDRLNVALEILRLEGYDTVNLQVAQLGSKSGNKTTILTLVPPGTTYQEAKKNVATIDNAIGVYNGPRVEDDEYHNIEKPTAIDAKRVFIRYAEDGGVDKDGLIELRRGVEDISLGRAAYAQVRIAVDDDENNHMYLKGMAMHTDNIPEGYDIVFNTNKKRGTPITKVFKKIDESVAENNPENPFGASIRLNPGDDYIFQRHYIDPETGEKKLSAINVVNTEGDWSKWSKSVASQLLAKQPPELVHHQLDLTYEAREKQFNEIMSLTNPVVKQTLLNEFEKNVDRAAVDLKAVAFPGQSTRVLLPFPDMNPKQVYCPGYEDGELVALVRYPLEGIFEIPVREVNNKYPEAKKILGNAVDAVGLHPSTSRQMSGADHDGDTALVIPIRDKNGNKITDLSTIESLEDIEPYNELLTFDTNEFALPDEVVATRDLEKKGLGKRDPRLMKDDKAKGNEMGVATNLIADITDKGASAEELVRATKYAMVVIDSVKHNLDWKRARKFYKIDELNKLYRGGKGGVDTIMTKAKSPEFVYATKEKAFSKMTDEEKARYLEGEKILEYAKTERHTWRDKETGELHDYESHGKRVQVSKMELADDARDVRGSEPSEIENLYADFANRLKALAKRARKESRNMVIDSKSTDPELKARYKPELDSLQEQLNQALATKPIEKQAQAYANKLMNVYAADNPDLDEEHYRKQGARFLEKARERLGIKQYRIKVTDREWEAIQSGVVSKTKLEQILRYSDMDQIKKLAMPRQTTELTNAQIDWARNQIAKGVDVSVIAKQLQVSESTINNKIDYTKIRHSAIQANLL